MYLLLRLLYPIRIQWMLLNSDCSWLAKGMYQKDCACVIPHWKEAANTPVRYFSPNNNINTTCCCFNHIQWKCIIIFMIIDFIHSANCPKKEKVPCNWGWIMSDPKSQAKMGEFLPITIKGTHQNPDEMDSYQSTWTPWGQVGQIGIWGLYPCINVPADNDQSHEQYLGIRLREGITGSKDGMQINKRHSAEWLGHVNCVTRKWKRTSFSLLGLFFLWDMHINLLQNVSSIHF